METASKHYIAEMWGIKANKLNDLKNIKKQMSLAVKKSKGTELNNFGHKFSPQGVSVVITISESHLSIHTFPEHGYCAVDIYTCGNTKPYDAVKHLIKCFEPKKTNILEITRGFKEGMSIKPI